MIDVMEKDSKINISGSVPFKDSIAQRLFVFVFAIYLVISIIITSGQIVENYTRTKNDIYRELQIFAKSFSSGMSKAIWEYDETVLNSSLQGLVEIPGVQGVKVISPSNGKILASIGYIVDNNGKGSYISLSAENKNTIMKNGLVSKPFWYEYDNVYRQLDGKVLVIAHTAIYSDTSIVIERIRFSVLVIVLSEIIEIIAMWFLFLLISRRVLGRPLSILTEATVRLAHDDINDFNVDIKSKGRHELKLLEEAFNSTAAKLKAAKDELENRMRLALNAGRIATWIWYPDLDRLEFDKNLPNILGQNLDRFGSSLEDITKLIHQDDSQRFVQVIKEAVSLYKSFEVDIKVVSSDGSILYVSLQAAIIEGKDGKFPLRLIGVAMDITERKIAENNLLESEERFRQIADNIPLVLWMISVDTKTMHFISNSYQRVWQKSCQSLYDNPLSWIESIHSEDKERVSKCFEKIAHTGYFDEEYRIINTDNEVRWIHDHATPIRNKDGEIYRIAGFAEDVTERKKLNTNLIKAKKDAEFANRAKSDFLATMSHEIRTPMNAVQGTVELLRRQNMTDKQFKMVDTISYATKTLLNILDDILDLSKIEDNKLSLELIDFELSTLLEKLVSISQPNAEKKGLKLAFSMDNDVPNLVHGDPHRFRQILWNLINNAIKFTDQGEVSIHTRKIGLEKNVVSLEFLVIDSGIGISPEKLMTVFDPFVQIDSSKSREQHGTGLGLAICNRLADLMGGTIKVNSTLGSGSTFHVVLPFGIKNGSSIQKKEKEVSAPLPLSLLVVDDEPVSKLIVQALLSDEGYNVIVASSGQEALELVSQHEIQVILMDLRMPKMDGLETTRRIRALPGDKLASIKIVVFTGDVMADTVQQCLNEGMDGVIAKPIDIVEINRVLSDLMGYRSA
jgi:PAS domain S-box-containing protein